jgi:hypothetical protein
MSSIMSRLLVADRVPWTVAGRPRWSNKNTTISMMVGIQHLFFEPAMDVRVIVLSFQRNAKEWQQHYTSLSAHNTLLQHRRQAHPTQPPNGEKGAPRPRHNQHQRHNSEITKADVPLLMRLVGGAKRASGRA